MCQEPTPYILLGTFVASIKTEGDLRDAIATEVAVKSFC